MNKDVYRMLKEAGVAKLYMIMLILRSPFDIINSVITANMIQSFIRIAERGTEEILWKNVLIYLVLTVLLFGYNMTVWSTIAVKSGVLLQKNLRRMVFSRIMALKPEELEGAFGADWITRLNNDIDKACGYLNSPINYMHMMIALVNLCISSVIMLFLNMELYVIGIVWVAAAFLLNVLLVSRKISEYKAKSQKGLVEYTELIDTAVKNGEVLSVFDGGAFMREKISGASMNILKENMRAHNRISLCNMNYAFSGMLGYLAMLVRGNDFSGAAMEDFAALCKMTQYRANAVMSVNMIYNSINNMKGSMVGVQRVNEVISGDRFGEC